MVVSCRDRINSWCSCVSSSGSAISGSVVSSISGGCFSGGCVISRLILFTTGNKDETKKKRKEVLADIQSGKFTKDWMKECEGGQKNFLKTRKDLADHSIEKVGSQLRDMIHGLEIECHYGIKSPLMK